MEMIGEVKQLKLACNTRAMNILSFDSVSLDGVSPPQVCISTSEKMVGILIYEWMVSEFSGNAFSQPSPLDSRKLILTDGRSAPVHCFTIN